MLLTHNEIIHAAQKRGLTIAELCRRAGVVPQTLHLWKTGGDPSIRILKKLNAVLDDQPEAKQ